MVWRQVPRRPRLLASLLIDRTGRSLEGRAPSPRSSVQGNDPNARPRIDFVHLRRALLLFAIVLGVAAVAAALTRPADDPEKEDPAALIAPSPERADRPSEPEVLAVDASERNRVGTEAGAAATLVVSAPTAGLVEVPGLGLSAATDELTPARFELLPPEPGRFAIRFTPAGADDAERAGTLVVAAPR